MSLMFNRLRGKPLAGILLCLVVAATAIQIGPMARPSFAHEPTMLCTNVRKNEIITETMSDGTIQKWICRVPEGRTTGFWLLIPGSRQKTKAKPSARSATYSWLNVGIGTSNSGNLALVVGYELFDGGWRYHVDKPLQIRFILRNRSNGGTCADTGWHRPGTGHVTDLEVVRSCGSSGYYELTGGGGYWTGSQWLFDTGWVNSGTIFWQPPCCAPAPGSKP